MANKKNRDKDSLATWQVCCCVLLFLLGVTGLVFGVTSFGLGIKNQQDLQAEINTLAYAVAHSTGATGATGASGGPECTSISIYMTYNNPSNNNSILIDFSPYTNSVTELGYIGVDIDFLFTTPFNGIYGIKSDLNVSQGIRYGFALYTINKQTGAGAFICENIMDLNFNINLAFGVTDGFELYVAVRIGSETIFTLSRINILTCEHTEIYNFTSNVYDPVAGTIFNNTLYFLQSSIPTVDPFLIATSLTTFTPLQIGRVIGNFITLNSIQMFPFCPFAVQSAVYMQLFYQNLIGTMFFQAINPQTANVTSNGITFPSGTGIDTLYGAAGGCWCDTTT